MTRIARQPVINLRTKHNFVKHLHYNSVAFIFSRVSGSSNRKRFSLVSPHVIFSDYEIIQQNGGLLKSQTDVIIQKCRSKSSLDSLRRIIFFNFIFITHTDTGRFFFRIAWSHYRTGAGRRLYIMMTSADVWPGIVRHRTVPGQRYKL